MAPQPVDLERFLAVRQRVLLALQQPSMFAHPQQQRPEAAIPCLAALLAGDNLPRGADDQRVRRRAILGAILLDGAHTLALEVLGEAVRLHGLYSPVLMLPGNGHVC